MLRLFLLLLAWFPSDAPDPASPAHRQETVAPDPANLRKLHVWTQRARRGREGLDDRQRGLLREVLEELDRLRVADASHARAIDLGLLELGALRAIPPERKDPEGLELTRTVADYGIERLVERLDHEPRTFGGWLANEVMVEPEQEPEGRTLAAELLAGRRIRETRSALLVTGRTADDRLGEAAVEALIGWSDPLVHEFFLDRLEDSGAGITVLSEHLKGVAKDLSPGLRERVRTLVSTMYLSTDWRDAARARSLVRVLPTRRAVPLLLEALAVWDRRTRDGEGSVRITAEVVRELQRRSGRSIGAVPERWNSWWNAVIEGRVELPETIQRRGGFVSSASFFGLNVHSDRIAFVIDRSGSMDGLVGTDGRTRFSEAVDQFLQCLEHVDETTRFALVLFSDSGSRWPGGLSPVTPAALNNAQRWLERNRPKGGTRLFEGLRAALELDRSGHLKPDRLEVDTVIVLCDGATAEGPDWVRPWIRRENEQAQVVFHCVQIGHTGNGTLEELAAASGGDFVRVD